MAEEKQRIPLPEGRVINCHLFEKDAYTDPKTQQKGTPRYRIEMTFEPDEVIGEGTIEDDLIEAALEEWPDMDENDIIDQVDYKSPLLDGDKLAKRRERKGKEGDAYKGKVVIRADTAFNKHGEDGPGGVEVYDENVEEITPANRHEVYPGCYGIPVVTISNYVDNDGNPAQKFYLEAFQKTRDGDKLVTKQSAAGMFKPIGKKRKSRKGGDDEESGGSRRRRK